MQALIADLRFGLRLFFRSPGFTAIAVATLALGIAANTTVFTWMEGLVLRPFSGTGAPDRLVALESVTRGAPNGGTHVSWVDCRDYGKVLSSISGLALHREDVLSIGDAASDGIWAELVSGNYFDVLQVKPARGRFFSAEEAGEKPGAYPVAVVGDRYWRTRLKADPRVVGKTIRVNRRELTVIGVAPPAFHGTVPGVAFEMWIPLTMGPDLGVIDASTFTNRAYRNLSALARLKPGRTVEEARAELALAARSLAALAPDTNRNVTATLLPAWHAHSGATELTGRVLRILMAVSGVVLLIVCANVANLLLARTVSRQKEFSVRLALGAGRGRLARQLLAESLILSAAGAVAAVPASIWLVDLLPLLFPSGPYPIIAGFELSGRVLAFTAAACMAAALVAGAAPALLSFRSDLSGALKEGGRSGSGGAQSHRLRDLLVVAEVALAAVALAGAGLFARSFEAARSIDPGFDRNGVLMSRFHPASAGYTPEARVRFSARLKEKLAKAHGIEAASYADYAPLMTSAGPFHRLDVEGYAPAPGENMSINRTLVSPGYFSLLRTPLLQGRDFADSDGPESLQVAIVNETFARRYFPSGNAVGRRFRCLEKWRTVVGVVKDSKYFHIAEAPRPHFFAPLPQMYRSGLQLYFFVRTSGGATPGIAAVRRAVAETDAAAGTVQTMPLAAWNEITLLPEKAAAALLAALGLIATLLAAAGLYGVMAYSVSQRTREIGIRMALGARPGDVLAATLRHGLGLTAAGLVVGIAAALAVAPLVSSMLVRLNASDPKTFAGAAAFLTAVGLLASYLPARRATKVDPQAALRRE